MSELLTFITAIGPQHVSIAERAIASVRAQTLPVRMLYEVDASATGPAPIRNRLLAQVDTPFVAFLDADDWVEPDWAYKTLSAYEQGHYVYTDHWQGERRMVAGPRAFLNREVQNEAYTWHPITALVPTEAARAVGFDEALPGGEDTAFYMGLMARGVCGKWLAEPLFHYGANGSRGKAFYVHPKRVELLTEIWTRYRGEAMSCCGDNQPAVLDPVGAQQPGDVLAQSLWEGNRVERGSVTGRMYPRTGNGKTLWVNATDAVARPDLFRIVEAVKPPPTPQAVPPSVLLEQARRKREEVTPPPPHGVAEVAERIFGVAVAEPVVTIDDLTAKPPAPKRPDVKEVQRRARKAKK